MLNGLYCTIVPNIVWKPMTITRKAKYVCREYTHTHTEFPARPHKHTHTCEEELSLHHYFGLYRFDGCSCIHNVIPFGKRCVFCVVYARFSCPLLLCRHHTEFAPTALPHTIIAYTIFDWIRTDFSLIMRKRMSIVLCSGSLLLLFFLQKKKKTEEEKYRKE